MATTIMRTRGEKVRKALMPGPLITKLHPKAILVNLVIRMLELYPSRQEPSTHRDLMNKDAFFCSLEHLITG